MLQAKTEVVRVRAEARHSVRSHELVVDAAQAAAAEAARNHEAARTRVEAKAKASEAAASELAEATAKAAEAKDLKVRARIVGSISGVNALLV